MNGEWMVNGKWKGKTRNDKCSTCLQDKSTTLKLIPMLNPKQLLFSSNLLLKIQQNNSIFGISLSFLFFFSIFFFFEEFIPSFYFWFFFFFFEQIQQNKMIPHTCLLVYYHTNQNPKHKNTRSHYHRLANINKTRVRWCGWTKETANECLVQKGIPKVRV